MKTRDFVALATGALTLTALAVPAAHADDRPAGTSAGSNAAAQEPGPLDDDIDRFVVNDGKDLVVGVSPKEFTVTFTAKHHSGIKKGLAVLWRGGADVESAERVLAPRINDDGTVPRFCDNIVLRFSSCVIPIVADPKGEDVPDVDLNNEYAGRWNVAASLTFNNTGVEIDDRFTTHYVKRAAKLTADASPESVRRGADVTVKGVLTRANWDTHRYDGFGGGAGKVKLQFKKAGGAWQTVKTVSADRRGKVKATVKASVDGSYRLAYGGSTTTGTATSPADTIDVR
ncbi:calcium-binding protein [Streptomyces sp. NPDC059816]|uniref:calcium-binding protein n=1 Tax=Streptomyces sp. NPDC059816 TaxID=3346960 RepID=UPI0036511E0F